MYNNIFEPERFFKMILLNYISNKIDNDNGAIMVLMVILVRLFLCSVNPGLFLDSPPADSSIIPAFSCERLHHLLLISSNSFHA